jgi:signal transduction histidine kinase
MNEHRGQLARLPSTNNPFNLVRLIIMKPVLPSRKRFQLLHSMTYRLPATYAAMALLVALSLGAVLQITLRTRFAAQEQAYLASNAEPMASILPLLLLQDDTNILEKQLSFFSFLVRAKVEIYDTQGDVIAQADIFDHDNFRPPRDYAQGISIQSETLEGGNFNLMIAPQLRPDIEGDNPTIFYPAPPDTVPDITSAITFGVGGGSTNELSIQIAPSVFGYDISRNETRSDQVVEQAIISSDGTALGILRLSKGPAYGVSLVRGIMSGWLLASIVSVAFAVIVSWFVSRDVVNPLTALSKTTQQMAAGDLSARASIKRSDEFGTLSESFNHMAQRIEEIVSTLRRFVSDAAHEINTPITALRTNLELLEGETDRETLERALGQLQRLEDLAKNLLQLSRLESALDVSTTEAVDLVALAQEVAQAHASQAEQAGIDLVLEMPNAELRVQVNAIQVHQAVSNLIHNAVKFTPHGGKITVQVQQYTGEARLTVEDTGIGIPEADLPYLFNRFHRGRNVARYAGSGLGLAIVQAIIQSFEGQIIAENTGHGARFTIIFPQYNTL